MSHALRAGVTDRYGEKVPTTAKVAYPRSVADYVYPPVVRASLGLYRALDISLIDRGWQNIPASGGGVVCSNHISYLDFIFVGTPPWLAQRRLTRFMAKDGVFKHKVSGPLMRGMKHIPVDREAGAESMRHAQGALMSGELVGMFPEATISQSFVVKEMKTGAVRMAAEANVPIIPMAVWGTQQYWTKNQPRKFFRHHAVCLFVGEPMWVSPQDDMVARTRQLQGVIQGLLDDAQQAHPSTANPGPGAWWLPRHLGGTAPTPQEAAMWDRAERSARKAKRLGGS